MIDDSSLMRDGEYLPQTDDWKLIETEHRGEIIRQLREQIKAQDKEIRLLKKRVKELEDLRGASPDETGAGR